MNPFRRHRHARPAPGRPIRPDVVNLFMPPLRPGGLVNPPGPVVLPRFYEPTADQHLAERIRALTAEVHALHEAVDRLVDREAGT